MVRVKLYLLECNLGVLVADAFREAFFDILRDKLRDTFRDVCFDTIRTLLACSLLLRCFERATPWLIVLHLKPAEPTIFFVTLFLTPLFSNNDYYSTARVTCSRFVTSFRGQNDN